MKSKKFLFVVFCIFLLMNFVNIVNATEYEIEEHETTVLTTPVITPDTSEEGEIVEEYQEGEIYVDVEDDDEYSSEGIIYWDFKPENGSNTVIMNDEGYTEFVGEEYKEYFLYETEEVDKNFGEAYLDNYDMVVYLYIILINIIVFIIVIILLIIKGIKSRKKNN